jgi:hypothetical protein
VRGPASAPSYVNEYASVLVRAAIVVAIDCFPLPAGSRHSIEVADLQLLVVHGVAPMEMVGDVSVEPKFVPDSESVAPPVVGPFGALTCVITGAESQSRISQ